MNDKNNVLYFLIITVLICVSAGLTLYSINNCKCQDKQVITERVLINISVTDTLSKGIDEKLNCVLRDLHQMKRDSVVVEVRKIHN